MIDNRGVIAKNRFKSGDLVLAPNSQSVSIKEVKTHETTNPSITARG